MITIDICLYNQRDVTHVLDKYILYYKFKYISLSLQVRINNVITIKI